MILLGTIVNAVSIIAGALIGILLGKAIPEHLGDSVMKGLALCTILIASGGLGDGENPLITIFSMVAGVLIGEGLDLDGRLNRLGEKLQNTFGKKNGSVSITEGFITSSLLFCVGAMAIMGSLQSGLSCDHSTLYTKSIMDFCSSVIFASSLGIGVALSSVSVFLLQGSITVLASFVAPFLQTAIGEMNCVGSLLLLALALNLLGVTKIRVMNYVPAIFLPILLCQFM
ncbi:MAG: DUF554 domain-containing protein [Oscillospiraceae bacterium]|nr:DUF554 domain-containing protein [Oscillospiraceae bacterium]MBR2929580.1 DUF554 domain-containing protein [Oscillospiraceae bacterium]